MNLSSPWSPVHLLCTSLQLPELSVLFIVSALRSCLSLQSGNLGGDQGLRLTQFSFFSLCFSNHLLKCWLDPIFTRNFYKMSFLCQSVTRESDSEWVAHVPVILGLSFRLWFVSVFAGGCFARTGVCTPCLCLAPSESEEGISSS